MFATASHLGRRVISALGLISLAIETGQGFSRLAMENPELQML